MKIVHFAKVVDIVCYTLKVTCFYNIIEETSFFSKQFCFLPHLHIFAYLMSLKVGLVTQVQNRSILVIFERWITQKRNMNLIYQNLKHVSSDSDVTGKKIKMVGKCEMVTSQFKWKAILFEQWPKPHVEYCEISKIGCSNHLAYLMHCLSHIFKKFP